MFANRQLWKSVNVTLNYLVWQKVWFYNKSDNIWFYQQQTNINNIIK